MRTRLVPAPADGLRGQVRAGIRNASYRDLASGPASLPRDRDFVGERGIMDRIIYPRDTEHGQLLLLRAQSFPAVVGEVRGPTQNRPNCLPVGGDGLLRGVQHAPVAALAFCQPANVTSSVIDGRFASATGSWSMSTCRS